MMIKIQNICFEIVIICNRSGQHVGRDIAICESGRKRRIRLVSGVPWRSRTADSRADAMQAQTALGVSERNAQLPATTHVHTMSCLPYDLRREERQSTTGDDELDANTARTAGLSEYQHHTNHL